MKLVCPHCAKLIEVAESLAGQTTTCSLCQGPLTVPIAAPPIAPSPPAPAPAPAPVTPAPLPPPPPPPPTPDPLAETTVRKTSASNTSQASPSTSAGTGGTGGYGPGIFQKYFHSWSFPTWVHDWIGLVALAILFVLFFFPWVGIYAGYSRLIEQTGTGIAFGSAQNLREFDFLLTQLPGSPLIGLAFFLTLIGLILLVVLLVDRFLNPSALTKIKPLLDQVKTYKEVIVLGLLGVVTLIFLLHYLLLSFPLEEKAWGDKASDTMLLGLKLKTEGITAIKENSFEMVGLQWLTRRNYFGVAVLISFLGTVWCAGRYLQERGYMKNWPYLELHWPSPVPQLAQDKPPTLKDL